MLWAYALSYAIYGMVMSLSLSQSALFLQHHNSIRIKMHCRKIVQRYPICTPISPTANEKRTSTIMHTKYSMMKKITNADTESNAKRSGILKPPTLNMQLQMRDTITSNDHVFNIIIQLLCCYYNALFLCGLEMFPYYMQ